MDVSVDNYLNWIREGDVKDSFIECAIEKKADSFILRKAIEEGLEVEIINFEIMFLEQKDAHNKEIISESIIESQSILKSLRIADISQPFKYNDDIELPDFFGKTSKDYSSE